MPHLGLTPKQAVELDDPILKRPKGPGIPGRAFDGVLLAVFFGFTVIVVSGYASFGRHPELVASVAGAARWYGVAMNLFPVLHVWLAFAVLVAYVTRKAAMAWVPSFVALYVLSLSSELLGTGYGIPFGPYSYTPLLGAEWLGRVPVVIPLSWFTMAVAAYAVARRSITGVMTASRISVIAVASMLLLCWDLSLDPAMSHSTIYWIWGAHGPYYGMPWSNLAGWYVTGLVLASLLMLLGGDRWITRLHPKWVGAFFAINLLLPVGMNVASGLWLSVGVTAIALVAVAAFLKASTRVPSAAVSDRLLARAE
ncbi:MAG: carotenoid biosynthesis protein [Gemmatimonadaceae bacterium]